MRARYKWPGGTGIITIGDDATLGDVVKELTAKTLLTNFGIKFGPPNAMKALDMNRTDQTARDLGLHGEMLTLVPHNERRSSSRQSISAERSLRPESERSQKMGSHDVKVPWSARDGTLSFGGALPQQVLPSKLRQMMADYIQEHADVYSEAILGVPPQQYCQAITDPDRWGGGIEEEVSDQLQTQNIISFGEGKRDQCILVYSGIHYDRIAFSYSEYPYTDAMLPPEMDRTTWPVEDEEVLTKAAELVGKLHGAHYFTNMDGLVLKCDVDGCGWIGSGQAEGQRHAEETGHTQLSEIVDTQTDAILRKCNMRGYESADCPSLPTRGSVFRACSSIPADSGRTVGLLILVVICRRRLSNSVYQHSNKGNTREDIKAKSKAK
ncbi:Ovarian tumor, otubain [Cordyceps militaris CM01]|uniref:Ubiquitin thioesterase OTU n=1 Tax=Cordyceps militaris (strain CM01) TaxID=983644 RepID=G3J3S1_CORMM|nr:Ovarian tumor, otubain [Cordyceps militaris CM01]EGX96546.1 Ovarian tumor, otubain [Cordyceps militaris CM01]